MKKYLNLLIIISSSCLIGCQDAYQNDDIAAIVRGEEITFGELRFLSPDDKIMDNLDGMIKAKLAVQEVKKLNIDISEKLQEIEEMKEVGLGGVYPTKDVDSKWAKETREFADKQAKKLGMTPEEFYEKHYEKSQEISMYVVAYIEEMLGGPTGKESKDYTEQANRLLDELVLEYQDEIEVLIHE